MQSDDERIRRLNIQNDAAFDRLWASLRDRHADVSRLVFFGPRDGDSELVKTTRLPAIERWVMDDRLIDQIPVIGGSDK